MNKADKTTRQEDDIMTKADLKTGMIVTLRNGIEHMVFKDIVTTRENISSGSVLVLKVTVEDIENKFGRKIEIVRER